MATPVDEERDISNLAYSVYSTVLDALNKDIDLECQDTDSDVMECANEEQELRTSNESMSSTTSLLSVLRAPKPLDLTRKRKLQCKPGKHKKTRSSSSTYSEPKGVKPQDCVWKYSIEYLSVSHGKFFV